LLCMVDVIVSFSEYNSSEIFSPGRKPVNFMLIHFANMGK